jgi:hypothetical protein
MAGVSSARDDPDRIRPTQTSRTTALLIGLTAFIRYAPDMGEK